ncbi:MAG: PGF-pre-PGF domain-containing protein [Candidatus Aenigmatarchaeota archaeon]
MPKPLLALSVALGVCFLATAVWAACNVTDDTYISTDPVLTANETPCQVSDAGDEGVIIVNGSGISVTCAPGFNLTGSGLIGIHVLGSSVNLSGCEVRGYTTDIRSLFGTNNIFTENVFGGMNIYGKKATVRNNTFNSLYLGPDSNHTLVENNIVFGGVGIEHGGDTGFHQVINNFIRTAGNGITITAGLGGIPDVIRGNDIAGNPISGTSCIYTNIGANSLTIENNNFSCDYDLNGNPYTGIRNTIIGNDFRGNIPIAWPGLDPYGPSNNFIWNNRFWNPFTIRGVPWPGYEKNIWNTTTTAGTNIIGGPWIAGNWWSDYNGVDEDGDGIGDSELPHKGAFKQKDWLPLTGKRPKGPDSGGGGGFAPGNETGKEKENKNDNKNGGCGEGKIPICHATSSESNPYVFLCISENAADGNGNNDHSQHAGDIIPITDTNGDGVIDGNDCPTVAYDEDKEACKDGCKEGENEEINLERTTVVQIVITPAKNVQNVKIHIKRLPEKPSETDDLHGAVYQYLKIDKSATDEEIAQATIKFAVDNGWLATKNYDPDKIKLMRWHDGFWAELPTTKDSSDDEKTYYIATTPGFSYFAVVAEAAEAAGPTGAFMLGTESVMAGGVLILAAAGIVLFKRRGTHASRQPKLAPSYRSHWEPKKRGR